VTSQAASPGIRDLVDRAFEEGRLAHALLVHGSNLAEVEAYARGLALKLLGREPKADPEQQLARLPDAFALRPALKSRVIGVDPIRELARQIQHTPQSGTRKVALIHEADRMNASAANAFLKTLEEPPLDTTILLIATRPHALLPTIRSRCQFLRLPSHAGSFDEPRLKDWLQSYREWLGLLAGDPAPSKTAASRYVMGLYGLVERFRLLVETLGKETWKRQAKNLPEDMTDEEKDAEEARVALAIRQDFLGAIEAETERFARQAIPGDPAAARKLAEAVTALERGVALLRLNARGEVMLEAVLLQALRIWTAR